MDSKQDKMNQALVDKVYSTVRRVCAAEEEVLLLKGLRIGCVVDGEVDESLEDFPNSKGFRQILVKCSTATGSALLEAQIRRLKVIVCAKEKGYRHINLPVGIGYARRKDGGVMIDLFETFPTTDLVATQKAASACRNGHFLMRDFFRRAALEPCRKNSGSSLWSGCIVKCRVGVYTEPI